MTIVGADRIRDEVFAGVTSVELMRYLQVLEDCLGKKAEKNLLPLPRGDVQATYADIDDLVRDVGYRPETTIEEGLARFVDWYRDFYKD